MGLAGVLETSSKQESEMTNIQDSFYICACNCVNKAKLEEQQLKALAAYKQISEVAKKEVKYEK